MSEAWFWAAAGAGYPSVEADTHLEAVEALRDQVLAGAYSVPTYCFVAPEDVYLCQRIKRRLRK